MSDASTRGAALAGHGSASTTRTHRYRLDIDGLRAIAVIPVILYHADVPLFSGGFVGVDIFFVISGYLIMATLAEDIRRDRFSIAAFYERRIRRIFPALFVVALAATLAGGILLPPAAFREFGQSLIAMALFVSNVFFDRTGSGAAGYFANVSQSQLLLHTWSLSVEEQFYILLPFGLFFLRRQDEKVLLAFLAGLAVVSFGTSMWMVENRPLDAFYLVVPRAWELLVGALLAMKLAPELASSRARETAALFGVALIGYAIFTFSKQTPFPGANALLPSAGAWLIIYAGETGTSVVGRLLSTRAPVFIGKISYSLYLWHWPIIVFVRALNTGRLNAQSTLVIIVSSLIAAYLSFRFVEQPFRRKSAWLSRRRVLGGGIAVGVASIVVGAAIVAGDGLPQRYDGPTRQIIADNVARATERPSGDCGEWRRKIKGPSDIRDCQIGKAEKTNILFWGDSHVESLRPLVASLYEEGLLGGRGAVFAISQECVPDPHLNLVKAGYYCESFSLNALRRAAMPDIDTVFIGFSAWWTLTNNQVCEARDDRCTSVLSRDGAIDAFIRDLGDAVKELRARGKSVIVGLPAPRYNLMIPQMQINDAIFGSGYVTLQNVGVLRRLERNDYELLRTLLMAMARTLGATTFDPRASLCKTSDRCLYEKDGVSIYMDDNHIANRDIGIFRDSLATALR